MTNISRPLLFPASLQGDGSGSFTCIRSRPSHCSSGTAPPRSPNLILPPPPSLPSHGANPPTASSSSSPGSGSHLVPAHVDPHSACPAGPPPASSSAPIYLLLSAPPENQNWVRPMDAVGLRAVSNETYLLWGTVPYKETEARRCLVISPRSPSY